MAAKTESKTCLHCGTPFAPSTGSGDFCCSGCEHVYGVIKSGGFDEFYQLKNTHLKPVREKPFAERDWGWLSGWQAEAEAKKDESGVVSQAGGALAVEGITCVGCVWLIQRVFERQKGAVRMEAQADRGILHLRWQKGVFSAQAFAEALQSFGYLIAQPTASQLRQISAPAMRAGVAALFAIHAYGFSLPRYYPIDLADVHLRIFQLLSVFFYLITFAVAVAPFFERPLRSLRAGCWPNGYAPALGLGLGAVLCLIGIFGALPDLYRFDSFALAAVLLCVWGWVAPKQSAAIAEQSQKGAGIAALALGLGFGVIHESAAMGLASFCFVLIAAAPLCREDVLALFLRVSAFTLLFLALGLNWLWIAALIHGAVLGLQHLRKQLKGGTRSQR